MDSQKIYDQVHQHYSTVSRDTSARYSEAIARSFGYSEEELADIPEGSNLGLSCGNPLAIASIREGETVIDLGSGAGFDVFLAASRVGEAGKVIGVDMNKDMLVRANNIKSETRKTNVEFIESRITDMSVLDAGIADCVISNCIINLVPATEKHVVFNEIFRLLKPGGRVALSDILTKKPLPEKLKSDMVIYVGRIAGASMASDYEKFLRDAGFVEILVTDTHSDLNVYNQTKEQGSKEQEVCSSAKDMKTEKKDCSKSSKENWCAPITPSTRCAGACCSPESENSVVTETDLNEWAGSFKVYAIKSY